MSDNNTLYNVNDKLKVKLTDSVVKNSILGNFVRASEDGYLYVEIMSIINYKALSDKNIVDSPIKNSPISYFISQSDYNYPYYVYYICKLIESDKDEENTNFIVLCDEMIERENTFHATNNFKATISFDYKSNTAFNDSNIEQKIADLLMASQEIDGEIVENPYGITNFQFTKEESEQQLMYKNLNEANLVVSKIMRLKEAQPIVEDLLKIDSTSTVDTVNKRLDDLSSKVLHITSLLDPSVLEDA